MSTTAEEVDDRVGLSRTAEDEPVPLAHERARRRLDLEDPFVGWAAALGVTLLALFLRLWKLSTPREFLFDETYYAKDAWSLLKFGYAQDYVDGAKANTAILSGNPDPGWSGSPEMVVHPEIGKWLIALGEKAFGMDPFGWRISAAIVGTLMVLVLIRLVRRVTGSTFWGCVAGLLMCFDGLHFVLSRIALLDIFVAFFTLLAVHCHVADRDWFRARLAARIDGQVTSGWGPVRGLMLRPWLIAAGLTWGLACGTKWEAAYPLAAFGLLTWFWSAGARRSFGVRSPISRSAIADGIPAFFAVVGLALIVYVASWGGWLAHASVYEKHLSETQYTSFVSAKMDPTTGKNVCEGEPGDKHIVVDRTDPNSKWPTATAPDASGLGEVTQSLRSLWYYHQDLYTFHTNFLNCSTHIYQSKPIGWLLMYRAVGVDADTSIQPGTQGCAAPAGSDCLRIITLIGTPVLWWGGCLALLFSLLMWVGARDWRHGLAMVGIAATWLPWLQYDDRPIFSFYAIISLPFLILSCVLAMAALVGRSTTPTPRRTAGIIVAGTFFVLVLLNFAYFWPIFTDELLTHDEWAARMWFSKWI